MARQSALGGRVKYDWELVLRQVDDAYRREPTNARREALHSTFLDQLDWERKAYRREMIATARSAASEMKIIWDDDPERDLIFAKHWVEWRAAIRGKMRSLDEIERQLDDVFVRSIETLTSPRDPG